MQYNNIFTESETAELISLLDKFDKEICKTESTPRRDLIASYNLFFEQMYEDINSGNAEIRIDRNSHNEIIKSLKPNLRKEFWGTGETIIQRRIPALNSNATFPDTIPNVYFKKGKYYEYLEKEISKINPKTKQYFEYLSSAMDFNSIKIVVDLISNFKEYDISDDRIRLLIAIQYLSLNDSYLEHTESYTRLMNDIESKFAQRRKNI